MTYICAGCKKKLEYEIYGGYAMTEMKNLCHECWVKYIEIKHRHKRELERFWGECLIMEELIS